jgi:hypothetical protein
MKKQGKGNPAMTTLRLWTILCVGYLLVACAAGGPTTTTEESGEAGRAPTATTLSAVTDGDAALPGPEAVVERYLSAWQAAPAGNERLTYLGSDLQSLVEAGRPLSSISGLQEAPERFEVELVEGVLPEQTLVRAVLHYPDGPVMRSFVLAEEEAEWRIVGISSPETDQPYPPAPRGVVDAFLSAYQLGMSDDQTQRFLSGFRQADLPAGGIAELLELEGPLSEYVIESTTLQEDRSEATVRVSLGHEGQEEPRLFRLVQEDGVLGTGWYIAEVTRP